MFTNYLKIPIGAVNPKVRALLILFFNANELPRMRTFFLLSRSRDNHTPPIAKRASFICFCPILPTIPSISQFSNRKFCFWFCVTYGIICASWDLRLFTGYFQCLKWFFVNFHSNVKFIQFSFSKHIPSVQEAVAFLPRFIKFISEKINTVCTCS